jgi:hypothetical protein
MLTAILAAIAGAAVIALMTVVMLNRQPRPARAAAGRGRGGDSAPMFVSSDGSGGDAGDCSGSDGGSCGGDGGGGGGGD